VMPEVVAGRGSRQASPEDSRLENLQVGRVSQELARECGEQQAIGLAGRSSPDVLGKGLSRCNRQRNQSSEAAGLEVGPSPPRGWHAVVELSISVNRCRST